MATKPAKAKTTKAKPARAKAPAAAAKAEKAPRAAASAQRPIYQLKVTLKHSRPPIWRRIQVPSDVSLGELHWVLQLVMGWTNSHLHQFIVGRRPDWQYYGMTGFDLGDDVQDENRVKLSQIAPRAKAKFVYEYDFGDGWEHEVVVEKVLPPEPGARYPRCLAGEKACPPEDVGGVWGYAEFLQAINNPEHPEHADMLDWIGGGFDPEAFHLERANAALKRIK
jgi:hypothetical protein